MITITRAIPYSWVKDALRYVVYFVDHVGYDIDDERRAFVDWYLEREDYKDKLFEGETRAPLILGTYIGEKQPGRVILLECGTRKPVGELFMPLGDFS